MMVDEDNITTEGQGLLEYALILVLVAIVVLLILGLMGPQVGNIFSQVVQELNPAVTNPSPPPECYGSGLLPILVAVMGAMLALSRSRFGSQSLVLAQAGVQRLRLFDVRTEHVE